MTLPFSRFFPDGGNPVHINAFMPTLECWTVIWAYQCILSNAMVHLGVDVYSNLASRRLFYTNKSAVYITFKGVSAK